MNVLLRSLTVIAVLAALPAAPASAQSNAEPVRPTHLPLYTLFVDPPTRFAFIKLPDHWKFVGQLDPAQMGRLPPGTVTRLLPPDPDSGPPLAIEPPATASAPRS